MQERKLYRRPDADKPQRPGALLAVFFVFLFGFALCGLFWPRRDTSALENRRLAARPTPTLETLLNGRWSTAFAEYVQDQVPLRDAWLWLESAARAIGLQQVEEGGILLGRDGWMFTKQFGVGSGATAQLERNLKAVTEFAARQPGKVTFLLAPSAAVIYPELLPAGAPMIDENAALDDIFARVAAAGAAVIDPRQTFADHKDEYLYYRSDHHWTTLGAYRAYEQFCALRGLTPFDTGAAEAVEVPDFYGTHYSATRRWNLRPDTLTYYALDNEQTVYQVLGEASFAAQETKPMMDTGKLATRDKYAAFLGGNDGYTVIEGRGQGGILVVKDSYANCFIPYLTSNYAKIGVVDFRGTNYGVDAMLANEGYDEVLILYNFQTFVTDTHVGNFGRVNTAG